LQKSAPKLRIRLCRTWHGVVDETALKIIILKVRRKIINRMTSRRAKRKEGTYCRVMRILHENPDLTWREPPEKPDSRIGGTD
jgi:hypothetical protein